MLDWLREKRQTPRAIDRFWRQVLVSAINEELDRMAAIHGFQVFWLGFLARADAYEMGVPAVPLGELYAAEAWKRIGQRAHRICARRWSGQSKTGGFVRGAARADARPITTFARCPSNGWQRLGPVAADSFEHSPITGDAPVVRPRSHHAAARHAARPHHAVDVQQGRRPLPATGGQRIACAA